MSSPAASGYEKLELAQLFQSALGDSVEDLPPREYERIFDECIRRGHNWTKSRSSAFLKRFWAQMKTDAVHLFEKYLRSKEKHYILTKSDVVVLQAIKYKTHIYESMLIELCDTVPVTWETAQGSFSAAQKKSPSNSVTIQVNSVKPLDFGSTGLLSPVEADTPCTSVDVKLLDKLFPGQKNSSFAITNMEPIAKRVKKEDPNSGPIDYNLMAALGLPTKRNGAPTQNDSTATERDTEYCHRLSQSSTPSPSPVANGQSNNIKKSVTEGMRRKTEAKLYEHRNLQNTLQNVLAAEELVNSVNSDDVINLQKKLLEAQIVKENTINQYYKKKLEKVTRELEMMNGAN